MKTTILLLVSDPVIRSVLEETLEREGYTDIPFWLPAIWGRR